MKNLLLYTVFAFIAISVLGCSKDDPCEHESQIITDEMFSPALQNNFIGDPDTRNLSVYLPPSYKCDKGKHYPVVYLLHGIPFGERAFLDKAGWDALVGDVFMETADFPIEGFQAMIDGLIADGTIEEMIIVTPDATCAYGFSFYTNSALNGNYEEFIKNDLIKYIDQNYRTINEFEGRAVLGFSQGGGAALTFAMQYSGTFSVAAAHSPGITVEGIDAFLPLLILENPTGLNGPSPEKFATSLFYSLGAAFSPNLNNPPWYVDLPFQFPSGELIPSVWEKWLEYDGFVEIGQHGLNLHILNGLYLDCGDEDETGVHLALAPYHDILLQLGIDHEYEVFNGTHFNRLFSRMEKSLEYISIRLSQGE
jgi:S-formylglutathione hydrolase FrmB